MVIVYEHKWGTRDDSFGVFESERRARNCEFIFWVGTAFGDGGVESDEKDK